MTRATGCLLLSNGSLLNYGSTSKLLQYNWDTKELIYSKDMELEGAVEISRDGRPFLLVSDG